MTDKEQADKFLKQKCINCRHFGARISHAMCEYNITATHVGEPDHRHCDKKCKRFKIPDEWALRKARKLNKNGKVNKIYAVARAESRNAKKRKKRNVLRNEAIARKLEAGREYKDVAREYGLSITTLYNIRRSEHKRGRKTDPKRNMKVLKMLKAGKNYRTIAEKFGISIGTIHNIRKAV